MQDYIKRDSKQYAQTFARKLRGAAKSLQSFPERGQLVPEFEDKGIRELLVRPYRSLYFVGADRIEILAVIHGALRFNRN